MKITETDISKKISKTRLGNSEWSVLFFEFQNALTDFSGLMESMLHSLSHKCLVLFIDEGSVTMKWVETQKENLEKLFEVPKRD